MNRYVKYVLFGLLGLLGVFAALVGIVIATFNPNDYKPQLIHAIKEKSQRTLAVPGDIKLTLSPSVGMDLGPASISEYQGDQPFAAVESAQISLALFPLVRKQLVVDRVKVDGLIVHVRRNADGTTNFDDLLGKEAKSAPAQRSPEAEPSQFRFDIEIGRAS